MRWFFRRCLFYVFAIWVALTLNFLLPRLMPGDPAGGVLARLSPAQIQANPGIIQTYRALLGGGNNSVWQDYVIYLQRLSHLNFGISTSNYPGAGLRGDRADAPLFDRPRRRRLPPRVRHRHRDRDDRRLAARRHGRHVLRADADGAGRVPGLLHRAPRRLLLRAQARLVPDPARLRQRARARLQLGVRAERRAARRAAGPRDHGRLHRRLGAEHAHRDDQHDQRGLRRDGAGQGPEGPPRDDPLRRAQRDPAAAERVRRAVRRRRRRSRLHRVRVQLPGRRA